MKWNPATYEAWYRSGKGRWISNVEFAVVWQMLRAQVGESLLDAGCGTGHFSRCFRQAGLHVTAIDTDEPMLNFARQCGDSIDYLAADVLRLPFRDQAFDHCIAVTSLCFVSEPRQALKEMLRVTRKSVVIGLLNRTSLLYRLKHGRGGYAGARWDRARDIAHWAKELECQAEIESAVFLPTGGRISVVVEKLMPYRLPFGGLLAARIGKKETTRS